MILESLLRPSAATSVDLGHPRDGAWAASGFGTSSVAGIDLDEMRAMNFAAFYSCVNVLAGDMGSFPLMTYRRLEEGGKERATDLGLYRKLRYEPNPYMSATNWIQVLMVHALGWGNGYAEIERRQLNDEPLNLWPIHPSRVTPKIVNGELFYSVTQKTGGATTLTADRMFHIPGFGFDGLVGYNPVQLHCQTIGEGIATQEYGTEFYANGSFPGGFLKLPADLSPEAEGEYKRSFEEKHRGRGNKHRMGILKYGVEWQQAGVNPEAAQFFEIRKFLKLEMCGIMRVPPHKVGHVEDANNANMEQENLSYLTNSLRVWMVKIEQEGHRKLLPEDERDEYIIEFNIDAMLRADFKTRTEGYARLVAAGIYNRDECREMDNKNPIPDGLGKPFDRQVNTQPLGTANEKQEPDDEERQDSGNNQNENAIQAAREAVTRSYTAMAEDTLGRMIRRQKTEIEKKKLKTKAALDKYYADFGPALRAAIGPIADGYASAMLALLGGTANDQLAVDVGEATQDFVDGHCGNTIGAIESGDTSGTFNDARAGMESTTLFNSIQAIVEKQIEEKPCVTIK